MSSLRTTASLLAITLLAATLTPMVGAREILGGPNAAPPAVPDACASHPGTCDGVDGALGDVQDAHVDEDDPAGHAQEDADHLVNEHLVAGACADEPEACATVDDVAGGGAESPHNAVNIVAPEPGDGSLPGEPVTILWKADVYDMARTGKLFKVQTKSQDAGAAWTDVASYTCYQAEEDVFPSGTCKATWTPATGIHAIRVVFLSTTLDDVLCSLGANCDLVTPYYVDGTGVVLEDLCLTDGDACIPTTTTLTSVLQQATVGGQDDLAIRILTAKATSAAGTVSCDVFQAPEGETISAVASGDFTCELDLRSILEHPTEDAYVGTVTLSATGIDGAGNVVTITDGTYNVDTSPEPLAVTNLVGTAPTLVPNGQTVTLTFRTTYGSPVAKLGQPVRGEPFTVKDQTGATVCTGTTGVNGVAQCAVTGADAARTLTGQVTPRAGLASVPKSVGITWSSIVITRAQDADEPRTTLFANPDEVYAPAYVLTYSHNDAPVAGAVVSLSPPAGDASFETTDAAGLVRVPVVSAATAVVTFAVDGETTVLQAAGPAVTVTWSRVVVTLASIDDAFVNVGDDVTLTATATYEHDANLLLEEGVLVLGDDAPEACSLSAGGVADGALTVVVSCSDVNTASLPLALASSTRGITTLVPPLAIAATWTQVEVGGLAVDDAFVNVDDAVTLTGTATYAHDGSLVPAATLAFGPGVPAGCALDAGSVLLGALSATVTCADVQDLSDAGAALVLADATDDVTLLAEPLALRAVWTSITVTGIAVDDSFVNVGDEVTLTAAATYAHDAGAAVPAATLALGPGAPAGCTLVSGDVDDGLLTAVVACAGVNAASLPLVATTATDDVTRLTAALALDAVWTQVVVGGLAVDDAFVNVGDAVTLTGAATWAHDGSAVPSAALAFGAGAPAGCTLADAAVADGALSATVTCAHVQDSAAAGIPLVVAEATDDVTTLAAPLALQAVWTRIVVSGVELDDALVNVEDEVTLTGVASYAHDGSAVPAGTLAFGEGADAACAIVGATITDGALSATVTCDDVRDLSATGLPLVVATASHDVTQLAAPLAVQAIWTAVHVTYTTDTTASVLQPGAPVGFTAVVTFAHNGAPVENAAAMVKSRTPGDPDEFVCLTNEEGTCVIEVTKDMGAYTFDVTAFSTTLGEDGRLVPDVTRMTTLPDPTSYRWTAIAFEEFECFANNVPSACDGETFGVATPVVVRVRAVAADTSEPLAGVEIKLGGQTMTTNADGEASRTFTRFSVGGVTVTARGVAWTVDGETVTWTLPRSETLRFA